MLSVAGAGWTRSALGPPLICHTMHLEVEAPRFAGARAEAAKRGTLGPDLVKFLGATTDTLARMEAIRLSVIEVAELGDDARGASAARLVGVVLDTALGSEEPARQARALFDAAFLLGCCQQMGLGTGHGLGEEFGLWGYAHLQRALTRARDVKLSPAEIAGMEYAGALMSCPIMRARHSDAKLNRAVMHAYDEHIKRAKENAAADSPVMKNLEAHVAHFGAAVRDLRAQTG